MKIEIAITTEDDGSAKTTKSIDITDAVVKLADIVKALVSLPLTNAFQAPTEQATEPEAKAEEVAAPTATSEVAAEEVGSNASSEAVAQS